MPYHISRKNHRDRVSEQKEDSRKYLEIGVEEFQEGVGKKVIEAKWPRRGRPRK
jgi:hypothetical protein